MEIWVVGIDLGKSVFRLVGMDGHGNAVVRKRLSPSQKNPLNSFPKHTRNSLLSHTSVIPLFPPTVDT